MVKSVFTLPPPPKKKAKDKWSRNVIELPAGLLSAVCIWNIYSTTTFFHHREKAVAAYSEKPAMSLCSGSANLFQKIQLSHACKTALGGLQEVGNCVNGKNPKVSNR